MAATGFPKLDEKYKAYKERIRSEYESAWSALASALAQQHERGSRRPGRGQPRGRLPTAPNGTTRAGPRGHLPKLVPPVIRFGTVPLQLAALPGGISSHADLMEGVPTIFDFPRPATVPRAAPTS